MKKLLILSFLAVFGLTSFSQVTLVSTTLDPNHGPSGAIVYKYKYVERGVDTTFALKPTIDNWTSEVVVHCSSCNSSTAYLFYRTDPIGADSLKVIESFTPQDSLLLTKDRFGLRNVKFRGETSSAQYNYLSIIHNSLTAGTLWIYQTIKKRL